MSEFAGRQCVMPFDYHLAMGSERNRLARVVRSGVGVKFTRVEPRGGEVRRYSSSPVYNDGTYVITRRHLHGEWQAWVLMNLHDPTASSRGLHGVSNSNPYHVTRNAFPSLSAARAACEQHFAGTAKP